VPTGAQATMFVTDGKSKNRSNQKEAQQTSQKKHKKRQNTRNKGQATKISTTRSPETRVAQKKE